MTLTANDRLEALQNERDYWLDAWTNTRDELIRITDRFVALVGIGGATCGGTVAFNLMAPVFVVIIVLCVAAVVVFMGIATLRRATDTTGHAVDAIRNINYLRSEIAALPGAPSAIELLADRYPTSRPALNWRSAHSALAVPMIITSVIVGSLAGAFAGWMLWRGIDAPGRGAPEIVALAFGGFAVIVCTIECYGIERHFCVRRLVEIEAELRR